MKDISNLSNEDFDKNRYLETIKFTIDLLKVFKNLALHLQLLDLMT